jgi:MFS family permease
MSGALFVWMADWYGRKRHMWFGCVGICAGTIINALSTSVPMFIGSRFVMAFFVSWATVAAPLYLVEISPADYRGTLAGLYNTFYHVVSMCFVCVGVVCG